MKAFSGFTHIVIGIVVWIFFPQLNLPILILGSLFPDCDHRKAAMGRILPLWLVGFKHRSVTHKMWFVTVIALLIDLYWIKGIGWSFLIGCVSHIMGDVVSSKKN